MNLRELMVRLRAEVSLRMWTDAQATALAIVEACQREQAKRSGEAG